MTELNYGEHVWIDGEWTPWEQANVHLVTHSLHYGIAAFEGIRCYATDDGRSAIFRLDEHIERLLGSAKIGLLDTDYSKEELVDICKKAVTINQFDACYLRPFIWMGTGQMGLGAVNPVHCAVMSWEWGAYLGDEGLRNGIRAIVSSYVRTHPNVNMVRGKITGQYVNSILAKQEALMGGFEEAILLDTDGYVAEGSGENIFCVVDDTLWTPPLGASPILGGVTRGSVIRLARDAGLEVIERSFTRDSMYLADELFVCGTAAEVTPIREVDRRPIGDGTPGPITTQLQDLFFEVVHGRRSEYHSWLTFLDNG